MTFGLTYPQLKALDPCEEEFKAVCKALGGARKWNGNLVTAQKARDAGVSFNNILWAASAMARTDKELERRLRHFAADCAARVLHFFEKERPDDERVRNAIQAAHDYADGKIDDAARVAARVAAGGAAGAAAWDAARAAAWAAAGAAAWDAARAAAWAAAGAAAGAAARDAARAAAGAAAWVAAREWQFDRLIYWLSEDEPAPLALPKKAQVSA